MDEFPVGGVPGSGLFLPGADPDAVEMMLETLWRKRQASFLANGLSVLHSCPELAEATGFAEAFRGYQAARLARRRALMEHPCMRVWLRRISRLPLPGRRATREDVAALAGTLTDGERLLRAAPIHGFLLQRYDVDPMLADVIPPSYDFGDLERRRDFEHRNPYSLAFAGEVIGSALARIAQTWPGARASFAHFVKIVVHLPDLQSRSCSAARFAGAILISSSDESLLEIEESLVHECGHQILYNAMELDPLVRDDGRRTFRLPWSGSERDAYGYFHATYIYLILALYFERVARSDRHDRAAARCRLAAILLGLESALDDLAEADIFTRTGRRFFALMAVRAHETIARNRQICAT